MNDFQGTSMAAETAEPSEQPLADCGRAAGELLPVELNIVDHYARQRRCVLQGLPVVLGRNEKAEVILNDPWVSHEHCKLMQYGGMLIVRDLDSKNGVFLHGLRVLEAEVHSGDCLTLGRTEITIRYREAASAKSPADSGDDTVPMPAPPRPLRPSGPHTEELLY